MTAADVIDRYTKLSDLGVQIWIDGGWGVDALLRKQTRPHSDSDIVIQQKDVPRLRELLEEEGYEEVERDDTSPWNFVLGDHSGHEVDVHAIVFDADRNGLFGLPERGVIYPAASLTRTVTINGHRVRCISAEYVVRFHTAYEPHDTDFRDVSALCQRFGAYPIQKNTLA